MGPLKLLGIAINVGKMALGIGRQFAAATTTTTDDRIVERGDSFIRELHGVVESIEAAGVALKNAGKEVSGKDKAVMAAPLVTQAFLRAYGAMGRKVKDDKIDKFKAATAGIAGYIADIEDCLDED